MSSSSTPAISIQGISKIYPHSRVSNLESSIREQFSTLIRAPWRILTPLHNHRKKPIDALNPISFDIMSGEKLGIIGKNGSGKSTLLKILSRITLPTSGKATITGRMASILEVGTGFHPELTGQENIYLSGAVLGLKRDFVKSNMDSIVEFSGVGDFLDLPVKRYSSGMYVRLAFAVCAHIEADILLIDEVLAVGDMEFRTKCIARMEQLAKRGTTIVLVSHDMDTIDTFCDRAVLINRGQLAYLGPTRDAIDHYNKITASEAEEC